MILSSLSDSSLVGVVIFLFTMIDEDDGREDNNPTECCNGNPSSFY